MEPTIFKSANTVMASPHKNDPNIQGQDLAIYMGPNNHGGDVMISKWLPSPEELAALNAGGGIYLHIYGQQHPHVWLSAEDPFIHVPDLFCDEAIAPEASAEVFNGNHYAIVRLRGGNSVHSVIAGNGRTSFSVGEDRHEFGEEVEYLGTAAEVAELASVAQRLAKAGYIPVATAVFRRQIPAA